MADLERDVFDPDLVVAVLAAVCRPDAQELLPEPQIDDLLRAAIARNARILLEPERAEESDVKRKRAFDVAHRQVEVMDSLSGHRSLSVQSPGGWIAFARVEEEVIPVLYVEDAGRAANWYRRLGFLEEGSTN